MPQDKDGKKIAAGTLGVAGLAAVGYGLYKLLKRKPPIPPQNIVLSDLAISPEEVNPGQPVTISVVVTNIGGEAGSYTVELGGDFVAQKTVSLAPGESKAVSFTVTPTEIGEYFISVDGLTGSFLVTEMPVADIRVENLVISPATVYVGETVTISVIATNYGIASGSKTITMTVT